MFRNYLRVALRNLRRNLGYTLLNVAGLAAGLACVVLIGLWIQDELSYDDFHADADRTYRIVREWNLPQLQAAIDHTPPALAPALNRDAPQVDAAVRTHSRDGIVRHGATRRMESQMLFADAGFFDVFSFPVVKGTAALDRPGTVLLTPKRAAQYFDDTTDPIGQTLRFNGTELTVTGLVSPPPANSSITYSMVASLATLDPGTSWGANDYHTYVRLRPDVAPERFETDVLAPLVAENILPAYRDRFYDGGTVPADAAQFHAQPITGIHLGHGAPADLASSGSMTYVLLFGALAAFVLLLACINFTNLSTARSMQRASEVGVRKAMGAERRQLARQFLGESVLMVALATGLAVAASFALLPLFNTLAGKTIAASAVLRPINVVLLLGLVGVAGLLAGGYPALVLSRFSPTKTLRGHSASGDGQSVLRRVLVVLQFTVSIALLAGTAVVQHQVSYMQSKGLGFTSENVVVLDRLRSIDGPVQTRADARRVQDRIATLKQEMSALPGVETVASGYSLPGTFFINSMWSLDAPDAESHNMDYSFVGYDYVETLGLSMAAGRDFSRARAADTAAVVINESAARTLGFAPDKAIGHSVMRGDMPLKIIGVVEDFHYASLHEAIGPMLLFHESLRLPQYLAIRMAPNQPVPDVLASIRSTWSDLAAVPMEYSFLADDLDAQYRAEVRVERLFRTFAGLAILIACLGLFGLAAHAAQQRTREIGIRKALGARVSDIVALLSKDFLMLVGLAIIIATPLAYFGMQQWLERFAYRIDPSVTSFALASAIALLVATAAVSYQAWSAARTHPVRALRAH